MELKNTAGELHKANTSFNRQINQAKERISEIEVQLNEIKGEGKTREKRVKRNEQSLKEIWDVCQDLTSSVYLNVMGRMNPSWKTRSSILSRRTS